MKSRIRRENGKIYLDKVVVNLSPYGLNARNSAVVSRMCGHYNRDIAFEKNGNRGNGKSILDLMTLEADFGSVIDIIITGDDSGARTFAHKLLKGMKSEKNLYAASSEYYRKTHP